MSDDHNVFISWSGARSRWVAEAFREWLPVVLQSVKPWMSPEIEKGLRGQEVISDKLSKVKVGIVCLTPENMREPWILFESGALSKAVDKQSYVCTYLLGGLKFTEVEPPLSAFQHTSPDKADTLRLLNTINTALAVDPVESTILERAFDGLWPGFEKRLAEMPIVEGATIVKRSTEQLLSEVLEISRAQSDLVRALQAQLTHVEQTLYRAPFGDGGMIYSNSFVSGRSIPIASLAGYGPYDSFLDTVGAPRSDVVLRADGQTIRINQPNKADTKSKD
jgi:hypothetical protein